MARTDGRPNAHIQEKRPPSASSTPPARPAPGAEEQLEVQEGRQPTWRWAATVWAIVFLFLTALALFDLVAGLIFH
jgi:hypothetical protein